jgi:DNA-binding GntR family transcriptional regulator
MGAGSVTSQSAYLRLKGLILNGSLVPSEPLSERQLAARLNVSRMPVREALRKLENDGLLEIVPFRGAFVRHLGLAEVRDVYEARQAVEGMAAFLAAKRGATAKLRDFRTRLEASLKRSTSADLRKVQRDGAAFHTAIVEASGNGRLLTMVTSLRSEIALTLRMALEHEPKRICDTVAEHLLILDAIESGDAAESRDRMVAHLAAGLESRMRIFRSVR